MSEAIPTDVAQAIQLLLASGEYSSEADVLRDALAAFVSGEMILRRLQPGLPIWKRAAFSRLPNSIPSFASSTIFPRTMTHEVIVTRRGKDNSLQPDIDGGPRIGPIEGGAVVQRFRRRARESREVSAMRWPTSPENPMFPYEIRDFYVWSRQSSDSSRHFHDSRLCRCCSRSTAPRTVPSSRRRDLAYCSPSTSFSTSSFT